MKSAVFVNSTISVFVNEGNLCRNQARAGRVHRTERDFMFLRFLLLVLCGASLSAQVQVQGDAREAMLAKESAIGARLAEDVRSRTHAVDDPAIAEYVDRLGRRLAVGIGETWSFEVITDHVGGSTREPLSLLGGHIFVSLPLIAAAESEDELAGMMAHALAHVVIGLLRTQPPSLPKIPVVFIGGMSLGAGDEGVLIPMAVLNDQRSRELDADRIGARMMMDAGFNAAALVAYLSRTQRDRNVNYSPLPPRDQRLAALEEAVAKLTLGTQSPDGGFTVVRERARQLTTPPKREPPSLR
jgi:predicted Zn-dependent protease